MTQLITHNKMFLGAAPGQCVDMCAVKIENARLKEENAALRAELAAEKAGRLADRRWVNELWGVKNTVVDSSRKLALRWLVQDFLPSVKADEQGFRPLATKTLADATGMSKGASGDILAEFVTLGVVKRVENDGETPRYAVNPSQVANGSFIGRASPRKTKQGGDHSQPREKPLECPSCGATGRYLHVTCYSCGEMFSNAQGEPMPVDEPMGEGEKAAWERLDMLKAEAAEMGEGEEAAGEYLEMLKAAWEQIARERAAASEASVPPETASQAPRSIPQVEKPTVACFCGKPHKWMRHPEEDWICSACWSPIAWTFENRKLQSFGSERIQA